MADRCTCDCLEPVSLCTIKSVDCRWQVLFDHLVVLLCIQRSRSCGNSLYRHLAVILDRCCSALGALCSDDDYTVRTACTVDGCCGTVLEHVDGLDLLEVDGPHVSSGHAVDDHKRSLACHECVGTTEEDLERSIRVTSVWVGHCKTRNLSLEHTCRRGECTDVQVVCLEADNGSGNLFLGSLTITDGYRLVKYGVRRKRENHCETLLARCSECIVVISEI